MGTSSVSVCGARPLALAILLALLLHGDADAASTQGRGLDEGFQSPYAGVLWYNTFWARHVADAEPWRHKSGANETDPVSAAIARRMAAVGSTYGFARLWLSRRCPRTGGSDGTMSGITRRCYLRELGRLEDELRPRPPPPPESPDDKARREVLQISMQCTVQVYPWPEVTRNPVIKSRLRPYRPLGKSRCRW